MRYFKFVGDPEEYNGVNLNGIYDQDYRPDVWNTNTVLDLSIEYPDDWQEVLNEEQEPLLHETDLGYYAGEFLKSVFNNPECSKGSREEPMYSELIVKWAIDISKELIKQLKEECQHNQ